MRTGRWRTVARTLSGLACYPLMGWFLFLWSHALFSEPGPIPGMRGISQPVMLAAFALTILLPSAVIIAAHRYGWDVLHDITTYLAGFALLPVLFALAGTVSTASPMDGFSRTGTVAGGLILMVAALPFPLARRLLLRHVRTRFSP